MKNTAFFSFLAVAFLVGMSIFYGSCGSCNNPTCNLPAPDTILVQQISPSSVVLDWPPVEGASAYRVLVTEMAGSAAVFLDTTTTDDKLELSGLTPDTGYRAEVWALCASGQQSENSALISFRTESLIIADVVVMMKGGGCDCDTSETTTYTSVTQNETIPLSLDFNEQADMERAVFKIRVESVNGDRYHSMLIGFDEGCRIIKTYRGARCESQTIESELSPESDSNTIVFKKGDEGILIVKPTYDFNNSASFIIDFLGNTDYMFKYKPCTNSHGKCTK